jgi:hypothetical protein
VKNKDELIYDLIFSDKMNFSVDISDYITDIYQYENFVNDIKKILKKSKVSVINSSVLLSSKTAVWEIKVKK